jgi:hypothetical protein
LYSSGDPALTAAACPEETPVPGQTPVAAPLRLAVEPGVPAGTEILALGFGRFLAGEAMAVQPADACLVRMTETLSDPLLLTTDSDFRIYRRHSRQVVPCLTPD